MMDNNNSLLKTAAALGTLAVASGVCYVCYQKYFANPAEASAKRSISMAEKEENISKIMPELKMFEKLQVMVDPLAKKYHSLAISEASLLKECLTLEIFKDLMKKKSKSLFTFVELIKPGLQCPHGNPDDKSGKKCCGVVAGDSDCYKAFRPLFEKLISLRHPKFAWEQNVPKEKYDLRSFTKFISPTSQNAKVRQSIIGRKLGYPSSQVVKRLEIEVHRNLKNHNFPSNANIASRRIVCRILLKALSQSAAGHKNTAYNLLTISEADKVMLKERKLLPTMPTNQYHIAAGLARDWPDGRAVWMCNSLKIAAVINVVDHVTLIATDNDSGRFDQLGKQMAHFYENFVSGLISMNEELAIDEQNVFGYLTVFPELLGPAIILRAEVEQTRFGTFEKIEDFRLKLRENFKLNLRNVENHPQGKCSIVTVETELGLGCDGHTSMEAFKSAVERVTQLNKENILIKTSD